MNNKSIAKIFYEISDILEIQDVKFKPRAYEKTAMAIEESDTPLKLIYKHDGLRGLNKIPGVGESIAKKIEEIIKTGKLKYYQKLKKQFPVDILEISKIEGVGPKTTAKLYKKLGIKTVKQLEAAARKGKLKKIPDFGEKTEQNILAGMEFQKKEHGRMLLSEALPIAESIIEQLEKIPGVQKIVFAGSLRRMQETIGDIDLAATTKEPKKLMDAFIRLPQIKKIISKGPTRASVRLKDNEDVDLRVMKPEVYGAALQYFTGDKQHNIEVRKIAIKKGYKLNEYGLFRKGRLIACKTEEEIYSRLGMQTPPPEIRTNSGEIEASKKNKLPKLVNYNDIKGDLQMHTTWSDGNNSIAEMAEAAKKLGHKYIAITDHTKALGITAGLDEAGLSRHSKEIDKINKKIRGIRILKSAEVNILKDGSLDIKDDALKKLDIVGAAVHSGFKMPRDQMTKRIIRAIENPYVNIIFHPTGRRIGRRPGYELDWEKIFTACKKYGVALEIDSYPNRLDLRDEHIKKAINAGVKLTIDTDAHDKNHLKYIKFGIAQARRGWARKSDILNTKSADELLKTLKRMKNTS